MYRLNLRAITIKPKFLISISKILAFRIKRKHSFESMNMFRFVFEQNKYISSKHFECEEYLFIWRSFICIHEKNPNNFLKFFGFGNVVCVKKKKEKVEVMRIKSYFISVRYTSYKLIHGKCFFTHLIMIRM